MQISDIARILEAIAPPSLQEDYDNTGLLTGDPGRECTGILCTLDVTEEVIDEAVKKNCNCIVAHHPIIFRGLKRLTGANYTQRAVISAIKNDVAIYACHTNLDNRLAGVNAQIAEKLGMKKRAVLAPRQHTLRKLYTFVPPDHLEKVRDALFAAGAGNISSYSECSFTNPGTGTYKPGAGATPYIGTVGERKEATEIRLEVILPAFVEPDVIKALKQSHPYEEVAYDMIMLENAHQETGSGMIGEIDPMSEGAFLEMLLAEFDAKVVRHTPLTGRTVKRVAICGGAGSFLIPNALRAGADAYVTADVKYHEFFDADGRLLLCDIGHFESEQFTVDLFLDIFLQKFPTFAVLKSEIKTNPVNYFTGK